MAIDFNQIPKLEIQESDEEGSSTTVKYDDWTIAQLKEEGVWPHEYNAAWGIIPYIKRLKGDQVIGVEVGTERGESAYLILEKCLNVNLLYTVDPYIAYENWNGPVSQESVDKAHEIAKENIKDLGERVELLNMTSMQAFHKLKSEHRFDFIFVDGSVVEDDVYWDLTNWYNLLRPGGLFAGHNYQLTPVRDALTKFREENKIRIPINRTENMTYFWTKV